MLAAIPPGVPVVRCAYANPRARGEAQWPESARRLPWYDDVRGAMTAINGPALVAGSLYLAGEALSVLGEQTEQRDLTAQR